MKERYYKNFESKKEFEKWLDESIDEIDFDEVVYIEFAYKNNENNENQL